MQINKSLVSLYHLQLVEDACWHLSRVPSAFSKNLVKVERDGLLLNQPFDLLLHGRRQDPHQGLGGEPVLGALLVVALGHVGEHGVSGLVDVVDDLAKVLLEVAVGESLEVGQGCRGNVSLPLEVTLACDDQASQLVVLLHEGGEGLGELELVGGDGALASSQGELGLLVVWNQVPSSIGCLPHVGGEGNQVVILVDVVHDLNLEEGLGRVVHDLVGQLRLGNVLPQLLYASSSGLGGSVLVDHLVALVLGGNSVLQLADQLHHDGELASEERVLLRVHRVLVHLEQVQVHAGNCFNEPLEGSVDLEVLEEASRNAARGCPGETNLVVDDDRRVDGRPNQRLHDDVEVRLERGRRVADGDSHVDQVREVGLDSLDPLGEGLQLFTSTSSSFLLMSTYFSF